MFVSTTPKTFYQAVMFGIVAVLLGLFLCAILGWLKPELPEECDNWNKYYVMEIIMFLTGFSLRYLLTNDCIGIYLYDPQA